jgi:hypothetical protein
MSNCLARVGVFGVLANDDVIDLARFPHLLQLAVNLVPDARIQLDRTHVRVKIELLSIENHLRKAGQLGLWVGLTGLCENSFAVNFVTNRAEQNRVRSLALFKEPSGHSISCSA